MKVNKRQAHIAAAEVKDNLETGTMVPIPKTEAQTRPLTKLEPEEHAKDEIMDTEPPENRNIQKEGSVKEDKGTDDEMALILEAILG